MNVNLVRAPAQTHTHTHTQKNRKGLLAATVNVNPIRAHAHTHTHTHKNRKGLLAATVNVNPMTADQLPKQFSPALRECVAAALKHQYAPLLAPLCMGERERERECVCVCVCVYRPHCASALPLL